MTTTITSPNQLPACTLTMYTSKSADEVRIIAGDNTAYLYEQMTGGWCLYVEDAK